MRFNARRARDLSVYSSRATPPDYLIGLPGKSTCVVAAEYDAGPCYLLTTRADFILHTNPWDTTPRTYFAIPVEALPDITIEGVENGTHGHGE